MSTALHCLSISAGLEISIETRAEALYIFLTTNTRWTAQVLFFQIDIPVCLM